MTGFEARLMAALTAIDDQRSVSVRTGAGRTRLRLTFPVLIALGALMVLAATAVAGLYSPASFQPAGDVVVAGGSTYVKGSGCAGGSRVTFTLDGATALGATNADLIGQFSAELPIPTATVPGSHDLAATCRNNDGHEFVQHANVAVVGSLPRMGPSIGLGGDAVAGGSTFVKGSGCAAGSSVVFTLDAKTQLAAMAAGSDGSFYAEVTIPAGTTTGSHDLTAVCVDDHGATLVQNAKLVVVVRPPEEPAPESKS